MLVPVVSTGMTSVVKSLLTLKKPLHASTSIRSSSSKTMVAVEMAITKLQKKCLGKSSTPLQLAEAKAVDRAGQGVEEVVVHGMRRRHPLREKVKRLQWVVADPVAVGRRWRWQRLSGTEGPSALAVRGLPQAIAEATGPAAVTETHIMADIEEEGQEAKLEM